MSLISLSAAVNNMDLSVLCLLTVALAFVPLNSAQLHLIPLEKPGECPNPIISLPDHLTICLAQCSSDSDCKGTMKCCQMGCRRMCMEPKKGVSNPKPGECPPLPSCIPCRTNRECRNNLVCCFNGCINVCMMPLGGGCPRFAYKKCDDECLEDKNCPRNLKCCYNQCEGRRTCMEPPRDNNQGTCPRSGPQPGPQPGPRPIDCHKCFNDRQCPRGLKCCHNQCNVRTCMEPVQGMCPRLHFMRCEDECRDDSQCTRPFKCCYDECEGRKICMKPGIGPRPTRPRPTLPRPTLPRPTLPRPTRPRPTLTKPGTCPPAKPHYRPCDDECSQDHQCPGITKCCYSGCGLQCLTPLNMGPNA